MTEAVRPTPPPFAWADDFFTIGVTGTNGKTSTTLLVAAALRAAGHSTLVETTLGYTLDGEALDVPRTLTGYLAAFERAHTAGCRHAAVEVTSQALAQGYAKRWRFDLGVFTNLTRDHLAVHGSWEHYLASKAQLFVHLAPGRFAALNAADETSLLLDQVTPPDVKRLWYASPTRGELVHEPDLVAESVEPSARGTLVKLAPSALADQLDGTLETRLIGEVFAENALAAAAATLAAGLDPAAVKRGIAECPPIPGRFEVVASEPALVAVDYAHTPDALARTCDTARRLAGKSRVIIVFGAGGGADGEKRAPMGRAVGERADLAIITTDNPRDEDPKEIARELAKGCRRGGRAYVTLEPDRRAAIQRAVDGTRAGDVVVVCGKGHEKGQVVGKQTLPFSDLEEARRALGSAT
jgi:UDP-N-acetylmuramoyl-L-alanyl-D-glutamate--2,6-diaminopimelate ligase